jgi:hypothetical protein
MGCAMWWVLGGWNQVVKYLALKAIGFMVSVRDRCVLYVGSAQLPGTCPDFGMAARGYCPVCG